MNLSPLPFLEERTHTMTNLRIGHGYDVHRLTEGRALILGGVTIPYEKGLLGHSDADVLTHAVMDALLGAAALGDIGKLFPDSADGLPSASRFHIPVPSARQGMQDDAWKAASAAVRMPFQAVGCVQEGAFAAAFQAFF